MDFITRKDITINIGLNKEYKFIHFGDTHGICLDTIEKQDREKNWFSLKNHFSTIFNEKYNKDYQEISSIDAINKIINYVNNNASDGVIITGDLIDSYDASNYKLLKESIDKINKQTIFVPGNHEKGGIYNLNHIFEFDDLIIYGIDNSNRTVTDETIDSLIKYTKLNKPIIIVMHIPIKTDYNKDCFNNIEPYFYMDDSMNSIKFIDLLINCNNIKGIIAGHLHGSVIHEYAKDKIQLTCSSGLIGYINQITIK